MDQLRKLAGPDAIKGPAHAAAAAAGGQHMHAGHKPDQSAGSILPLAAAAGGPAAVAASAGAGAASSSMWHAAMRCMFAEYLQASGCLFTLSVFRYAGARLRIMNCRAAQHLLVIAYEVKGCAALGS